MQVYFKTHVHKFTLGAPFLYKVRLAINIFYTSVGNRSHLHCEVHHWRGGALISAVGNVALKFPFIVKQKRV